VIGHYRLFFEASPLPMWVYDVETLRFLAVNEAATRHYGWSREEFLAMTIAEIRPREDVQALLAHVRTETGSPMPGTWRHRRKDGSMIDVEITAGRIVLDGREAALVLAHDVTDRRRLEERLTQAEKMEAIGRLAGGVAHDFNNLLTVISGYASILRRQVGEREELAEIAHAAEQASSLTRQLLAFSRRQVLNPRVLDLNEIVTGMEPMVGRIIGDDVQLAVRVCAGSALVEADHAQLERVVLNLAANARDAMPQGGRLTIETSHVDLDQDAVAAHGEGRPGPHVVLAVSDSGAGMSEDVRRHLFEPFFTTKGGSGGGTGLGLATVFGVVKQSGGAIYVYTEPGHGTTFKIYFPAAEPATSAAAAPAAAEPADERGSETIVVVEDDASLRELVRLMLEGCGYEVLTAASADQAARLCAEHPGGVALLLTDVVMPEVNGRVLAERLGALFPSLRVLFMSGYSDEAIFRNGMIRPDTAFIEKPFSERTLARKVREVLDSA
jgi:two-component system cell cycle sensor histidine kinase/response regulator CckA